MSGFMKTLSRPRNLAIAGGVAGAVFLLPRTRTAQKASEVNPIGNVFNTPASQSVGDRFSAGGGTQTHTPAIATPKGQSQNTTTPHEQKGAGTAHFDRNQQSQKDEDSSVASRAFNQSALGTDKGK